MAFKKSFVNLDHRVFHRSRINLVAVELEGAWKKCPKDCVIVDSIHPEPNQLGRDGSLKNLKAKLSIEQAQAINAGLPVPWAQTNGELPSPPLKEGDEIADWMRTHWPDLVNEECGMHIHISVTNPLVYMWLADDEAFPVTVVEYMRRWAKAEGIPETDPIWARFEGKSEFCQHHHWPKEQLSRGDKDYDKERYGNRYTVIAFRGKTIECRLLSMPKDVEQGIRAVKEFCSIVNRYLVATAKREKKVVADVVVKQPCYEMNINLTV